MASSEPEQLPPHHSAVRSMWNEGHGLPYQAFETLEDARRHPDATAVMEGDCGGQIYFTCPVSRIRCSEADLRRLLDDLNGLSWGDGEDLYYEVLPVGRGVAGGMGGGLVLDGIWLHDEFELAGVRSEVEAVVAGASRGLSETSLQEARVRTEEFSSSQRSVEQVSATWRFLAEHTLPCTHCGLAGKAMVDFKLYIHQRNTQRQFIICRRCNWPQKLRWAWKVDKSIVDRLCPHCGQPLATSLARQCRHCGKKISDQASDHPASNG